MKRSIISLLVLSMWCINAAAQSDKLFAVSSGKIVFKSDAVFEIIKASSTQITGILDTDKNTFAFKVKLRTFEGFNSALQKEHFHENYVESDQYPEASFSGKIIEDINLKTEGSYSIRAKGYFNIHGISQERIIKCDLVVKDGKIMARSGFSVLLSDHNIPIPRVVKDKLNSEINVQVNCILSPR